jgi:hypothetical protein
VISSLVDQIPENLGFIFTADQADGGINGETEMIFFSHLGLL